MASYLYRSQILAHARRYAGHDFDRAGLVREDVVYTWRDEEWTIPEFMALLDSIPPEYADSARIEFVRGSYDESDSFRVYYVCPETDEAVAGRVARAYEYAIKTVSDERAQYEALKRKFG